MPILGTCHLQTKQKRNSTTVQTTSPKRSKRYFFELSIFLSLILLYLIAQKRHCIAAVTLVTVPILRLQVYNEMKLRRLMPYRNREKVESDEDFAREYKRFV